MQSHANHVHTLVAKYFQTSGPDLYIGGVPVRNLVADYDTPVFVYDRHVLDHKLHLLRSTLPARFSISYSVKANPNRRILQYFVTHGCGLEIASGGELLQALSAGCPPEKIIFAGPGKTAAELEMALTHGIHELHVESLLEIDRVSQISRRLDCQSRIALRINPCGEVQGGAMRMGGKSTPFGIDEECLDVVLDRVLPDTALFLNGIHLYIGTQILDHDIITGQYRRGLEIAKHVASRLQRPLQTIDFGGGLGIPYFSHESELNVSQLKAGLSTLMDEIVDDPAFTHSQFMVEPGRFLVGEAGLYITKVNDIKVSRGRKFLITDGGMHHHLAASGNLGQTIKRNYPVAVLNKFAFPAEETVDVVGPLCTPLDVLARAITLPKAEVGDLIGIFQSGAYALNASPQGFLSHPRPPEVWVEEGSSCLVHCRGSYADYSGVLF